MKLRSQIHMLTVAAARLEEDMANPQLIADLRAAADRLSKKIAQGRNHTDDDNRRIERHRTLFNLLPPSNATDRLKDAMLQQAYDLMWDGNGTGADALIEFLPSADVDRMLGAWMNDQDGKNPKSKWYGEKAA